MLHTKKNLRSSKIQNQTLYSNCHCSWIYKRNRFATDSLKKNICVLPRFNLSVHVYQNGSLSMFIEI